MADTGWVKMYRKMLEWEWYKDSNTKSLFLHLILKSNAKDGVFQGVLVPRGSVATSYSILSEELGLSTKQIRGSLDKLNRAQCTAVKRYPKFSVISILSYDDYQRQGTDKGTRRAQTRAPEGQAIPIKEYKKKEEAATPHVSPSGDLKVKDGEVDEYGFRWG